MKITFLGHACFLLEGSKRIIIDPFLTGNPLATKTPDEVEADYILVSHGHGDHIGDAITISQKTNAPIIAPFELATFCERKGATVHPMHIGGAFNFENVKVKLTPAWHGSAFIDDEGINYTGTPCGFLVWMDGECVYHAGDTGLFGDMKEVIGNYHKIDVALLPIGDNFVMGPEDAVIASKWLKAGTVIPMHYNTWPIIEQKDIEFQKLVESKTDSKCTILKPDQSFEA